MRHSRHHLVLTIGLLALAGPTTAALARPTTTHHHHRSTVAHRHSAHRTVHHHHRRLTRRHSRRNERVAARTPSRRLRPPAQRNQHHWLLPGFRLPPSWHESARHRAEQTPQAAARHAEHRRRTHLAERAHHRVEHAHLAIANVGLTPHPSALVAMARRYIGTNPTGRARLWCARFLNFVLKRAGYEGTGSDAARSFADYGHRISKPRYGAIAVLRRKGGGHVGIITGIDRHGDLILLSGNHGKSVGVGVYPRRRVIAYVMPKRAPHRPERVASAKAR